MVDSGYRDNSAFKINEYQNWKEFYPDAEEELPRHSHLLSMTAVGMRCTLFVLFCEAAITHFLDISLLAFLLVCETGEYWGRGPS